LRAREFELLGRLVRCIPVREVTFLRSAAALPQLVAGIRADFAGTRRAGPSA